jgi:hypothetical protein
MIRTLSKLMLTFCVLGVTVVGLRAMADANGDSANRVHGSWHGDHKLLTKIRAS